VIDISSRFVAFRFSGKQSGLARLINLSPASSLETFARRPPATPERVSSLLRDSAPVDGLDLLFNNT
jgi:hypothetical protein